MAQVAPPITEVDVLEAIADGFLHELQDYFPKHQISKCKTRNGWVIEGEREVVKPRGAHYALEFIWYNVIFNQLGVRIDGINGRSPNFFTYEDPRLLDFVKDAVYEYTKLW